MARVFYAIASVLVAAVALPAVAADSRYGPIGGDSGEMARELRGLIEEAEKARAADPRFLRDLRDLADRYDRPPLADVVFDDFADGDFTRNPTWQVISGRYCIERGYGLRSTVTPEPAPAAQTSDEDAAKQLFGAILQQALRGQQSGGQSPSASASDPAVIHIAKPFANAFSIRVELTSWQGEGHLEIGPYAAGNLDTGYRLIYRAGATPGLELVRLSRYGSGVVGTHPQGLVLEDRRVHVIEWTRTPFGDMTVAVDGTQLIHAGDRAIADPFDGLALINRGGDFVLARAQVQAAP